jgi:hypothetical protein
MTSDIESDQFGSKCGPIAVFFVRTQRYSKHEVCGLRP